MRYRGSINGLVNDFKQGKLQQPRKIYIDYTSDNIGKTLSLGSEEDDIQISIPFDELFKILK